MSGFKPTDSDKLLSMYFRSNFRSVQVSETDIKDIQQSYFIA
jgi:hypothetical protein